MNGRLAVLRLRDATLALAASLSLCLMPATQAFAGPIELSDILDIDPLGYRCIPSEFFDDQPDGTAAVAFSLSGKTRLPRTCLPDPCARALTKTELSQITGTEPILARFSEEWDDYYSRYADSCRREVVVSRPNTGNFWKPIIAAARDSQRVGIPTSSRLVPFIIADEDLPRIGAPILASFTDPAEGGVSLTSSQPSPVPLPTSGLLLAVAFGAGAYQTRRRKKAAKQS